MSFKKCKLFCFPYAGGSATIYNKWRQFIDKDIELYAVELAGRGKRVYDPLYNSIDEAVEDVYGIIKDELNGTPFGLFGHSLGGLVAFELAHKLRESCLPQPSCIFFSGRGAPHVPKREDKELYHKMCDEKFREEILDLGGTPKEFFEHPELLEVMLPMLKNDFRIAETYKSSEKIRAFDYDINVLIGKEEDVTAEQVHGWKEHTNKLCSTHYFAGGHFFINEETGRVVELINRTIEQQLKPEAQSLIRDAEENYSSRCFQC